MDESTPPLPKAPPLAPKDHAEEHAEQLRIYARLWYRDEEVNPDKKLATRLTLAYSFGEVDVTAPTGEELNELEKSARVQREMAHQSLSRQPPAACVSAEACRYCAVRQLCPEYWAAGAPRDLVATRYFDVQVRVTGRHGQHAWDVLVEAGAGLKAGITVVLRTPAGASLGLQQRVRLLDLLLSTPDESDEETAPILTMCRWSEVFLLPCVDQ